MTPQEQAALNKQITDRFEEIEADLTKDLTERKIENIIPLRDLYSYSIFCKNYIQEPNFEQHLNYFAYQNFIAFYYKKHGTLRGSNIIAWDNTPLKGIDDVRFLDHSIYKLENLQVADYNWYSRKYPLYNQHNHLQRKTQIKKMIEQNRETQEFFYPPIIGYRFGDDIYVLEGTRRISSILQDEQNSITNIDIFVVDLIVNEDGKNQAKNLHYFIQNSPSQIQSYQNLKIRNEASTGYYVFDYAQKREFIYPDLGQQITAIMKYIMTNDRTDVESMWTEIQRIRNEYPKQP